MGIKSWLKKIRKKDNPVEYSRDSFYQRIATGLIVDKNVRIDVVEKLISSLRRTDNLLDNCITSAASHRDFSSTRYMFNIALHRLEAEIADPSPSPEGDELIAPI